MKHLLDGLKAALYAALVVLVVVHVRFWWTATAVNVAIRQAVQDLDSTVKQIQVDEGRLAKAVAADHDAAVPKLAALEKQTYKLLGTVRGTFGQVETAAKAEQGYYRDFGAKSVTAMGDLDETIKKTGAAADEVSRSTFAVAWQAQQDLQDLDVQINNADVQDLMANLNGTVANLNSTTASFNRDALALEKRLNEVLKPASLAKRLFSGMLDLAWKGKTLAK